MEEGLVPARARYSGRIILKFWARVEMSASVYFHVYTHGALRRFMRRLRMKPAPLQVWKLLPAIPLP